MSLQDIKSIVVFCVLIACCLSHILVLYCRIYTSIYVSSVLLANSNPAWSEVNLNFCSINVFCLQSVIVWSCGEGLFIYIIIQRDEAAVQSVRCLTCNSNSFLAMISIVLCNTPCHIVYNGFLLGCVYQVLSINTLTKPSCFVNPCFIKNQYKIIKGSVILRGTILRNVGKSWCWILKEDDL